MKRYEHEVQDAQSRGDASAQAVGSVIANGLAIGVTGDQVTSKSATLYHREWALFGAGAQFIEGYVTQVPSHQMRGMPALGMGMDMDFGAAPLETKYFGLELEGLAWFGGLPSAGGGFYLLSVEARSSVRIGLDRIISFVGVTGVSYRFGGASIDCGGGFSDCYDSATISTFAAPLGGGLKICADADDVSGLCNTGLLFLATRHFVADVQGPYGSGVVGEFDLAMKSLRLQAWLSPDYPRAGAIPSSNTPSPGWMGGVTVTFFGFSGLHPYGHSTNKNMTDGAENP